MYYAQLLKSMDAAALRLDHYIILLRPTYVENPTALPTDATKMISMHAISDLIGHQLTTMEQDADMKGKLLQCRHEDEY